jgi:hypothetical protein
MAIPDGTVEVNPGKGRATMAVENAGVLDFTDFLNGLFGGGPAPVPAQVSFEVHWSDVLEHVKITNAPQGFAGTFVRTNATMEWSARVGNFSFVSRPAHTSSSVFAEIGQERNGDFFPH